MILIICVIVGPLHLSLLKTINHREVTFFHKLHENPTTLDKTVCAQLLAKFCIQDYVKVDCTLEKTNRAKVHKLKVFHSEF